MSEIFEVDMKKYVKEKAEKFLSTEMNELISEALPNGKMPPDENAIWRGIIENLISQIISDVKKVYLLEKTWREKQENGEKP